MSLQSLILPIKAVVLKSGVKINARKEGISLHLDSSVSQTTKNTRSFAFHDGMNHNQTFCTIQPLTVSVPSPGPLHSCHSAAAVRILWPLQWLPV